MNEIYKKIIERYSSDYYLLFVDKKFADNWKDETKANDFLKAYYLNDEFTNESTSLVMDFRKVFTNRYGFPKMCFKNNFKFGFETGGASLTKKTFAFLKLILKEFNEQNFYIIENNFNREEDKTLLKMKFPSTINWDELMNGSCISLKLFKVYHDDYFIFGDSGKWGIYVANDFEQPFNIIGIEETYSNLFNNFSTLTSSNILKKNVSSEYLKNVFNK